MKKFRFAVLAMLLIAALSTSAFAASISAHYSNGVISYTVSDIPAGKAVQVLVDSSPKDSASELSPSGKIYMELSAGTHKVTTSEGGLATIVVEGAPVEPEETATPEPPVETATPVAPVETATPVAPTKTAEVTKTPAPTKAPAADADDDVPKTGDTATVAYLIGAAMVLAAAYLLLRRRVHSK